MTLDNLTNVITKSIIIRRDIEAAFRVWTSQINVWWPKGHSISSNPKTQVFIEGKVGGRFYERTPDGREYIWGKVTVWDPPHRLVYHWYLGSSIERPTEVDIQFTAQAEAITRVDVKHHGPELAGDLWWERCSSYEAAWDHLLPSYVRQATP